MIDTAFLCFRSSVLKVYTKSSGGKILKPEWIECYNDGHYK